ncbi:MAG: tetratricopeptide repeat protein, partial [Candidatus Hermodarchaeota archaeon]
MKLTDLTIRDLFTPGVKLTFLVGAGCSIDKPSCLPAGRRMMNALLDYTCAKSELDKIKKLEGLRFEQLIEILSERLDPELKIIDFYGLCDKPNLQHFFLAEMMNQGHFVFTTNFDFLIEYALIHSGVPKNKIKVVITKEDFEKFDNPHELYSDGLKTLYKIHGSTENIITGIPTRASLIATIQAFGANKEGENAFQLEGFKQPAFLNLTKDRTLVVLGYSGSDDFDVVPTLKVLEDVRDIIWINHIQNDKKKENVYEIRVEDIQNYETLAKVDQILVDIKRMNYVNRVFRVDINTSIMVKELVSTQNEISSDIFDIDIHEWLSNNIETPNEVTQLYVPYKIYFDFDLFEDALPILDKMLKFAEEKKDLKLKTFILSAMGSIYEEKGEIQDALTLFEEALQLDDHLEDSIGKATRLNNIGGIYYAQGHYQEALKRYKEVLQIDEQSKNSSAISIDLNNIGMIFRAVGNYPKALILFKEALKISENLGNLKSKAVILNNLGGIYRDQGDYQEASKRYEEALQINVQLGDLRRKALLLNN